MLARRIAATVSIVALLALSPAGARAFPPVVERPAPRVPVPVPVLLPPPILEPPPRAGDFHSGTLSGSGGNDRLRADMRHALVYQAFLRDAGFNPGPVDGDIGPTSRRAIASFQDAEGIPITGRIDAVTENALNAAAADQRTIASVNVAKDGYVVAKTFTKRRGDEKAIYYVVGGNGRVVYTGNSAAEMRRALNAFAAEYSAQRVYLIPAKMSSDQRVALGVTIRNAAAGRGGTPVFVTHEIRELLEQSDLVGRRVREVVDDGREPRAVGSSSGGAAYEKSVGLRFEGGGTQTLSVVGRTKEIVKTFIANLRSEIAKLRLALAHSPNPALLAQLRTADLVSLALARTARDSNIAPSELHDYISAELSGFQIAVRVTRARAA